MRLTSNNKQNQREKRKSLASALSPMGHIMEMIVRVVLFTDIVMYTFLKNINLANLREGESKIQKKKKRLVVRMHGL